MHGVHQRYVHERSESNGVFARRKLHCGLRADGCRYVDEPNAVWSLPCRYLLRGGDEREDELR